MDKLQRLLDYINITNPDMSRERLLKELGECRYSSLTLIYTADKHENGR